MAPSIRILSKPIAINTDNLVRWYPKERWAIIAFHPDKPKEMVVEWASPKQLETFPELVGKICYKRTKGFSQPCEGCPCLQAIRDQRIVVGISPSPKHKVRSIEFDKDNIDTGEIIYSVLGAVPVDPRADGSNRVLEFSFDITDSETSRHEYRMQGYEFAATLCRYIETRIGKDAANELILFGAVAPKGMAFSKAHLMVVNSDIGSLDKSGTLISEILSLARDRKTTPKIEFIAEEFLIRSPQSDPDDLRSILFPLIKRTFYDPRFHCQSRYLKGAS